MAHVAFRIGTRAGYDCSAMQSKSHHDSVPCGVEHQRLIDVAEMVDLSFSSLESHLELILNGLEIAEGPISMNRSSVRVNII